MLIIGCDFHTRYQQIALVDNVTGELTERRFGPFERQRGSNEHLCFRGYSPRRQ
jgi:hypothetical protein